ncbi:MAG: hypothetical protein ACE5FF_14080 [Saprospiraceae bacterium]
MIKFLLLCSGLFYCQLLFSQDIIITGGGAGHFTVGPAYIYSANTTKYLRGSTLLGSGYNGPPPALQIGGEGYAMINKFLVGGGGFAIGGFESGAGGGAANISGAAGYFKFGYRFWSRETSFMTISGGAGAFGYNLELKNESAENGIAFDKASPVSIGETRKYKFGSALFDLSYGFKTMLLGSKDANGFGGILAGLDAGCLLDVPVGGWKSGTGPLPTGPPSPGLVVVPYFRLTFGGGGFGFRN